MDDRAVHVVALAVVLAALASVSAILLTYDDLYFAGPIRGAGLYPDDPVCGPECVAGLNPEYGCIEIAPDEYVCRPPRPGDLRHTRMATSAVPGEYGEIVWLSEGMIDDGQVAFTMKYIEIVDRTSGTILVEFADAASRDRVHSAILDRGDTFLVGCGDTSPYVPHLVQYMDLFEIENMTHAEFWAIHPDTPAPIYPCDLLRVIKISLEHDYDLRLPEYDEFLFP